MTDLFLLFALLSKKLTELIGMIIRKLFTRWPKTGEDIYGALKNPLRVFFVVLGVELAFLIISPETKWMTFIDKLFRMTNISLIAWVLLNYTPAATRQIIRFNDEKNVNQSEVAIRFMAIILRIVIVSLLSRVLRSSRTSPLTLGTTSPPLPPKALSKTSPCAPPACAPGTTSWSPFQTRRS